MNIEQVNSVLSRAIVAIQADEIESMSEAMAGSYRVPSPGKMGFTLPTPAEMHKKHGMSVPSGTVKGELLGKGKARKGMRLGNWAVVKASPPRVTVHHVDSVGALVRGGRALTYVWDGIGYTQQGSYLHTDGIHKLAGSKPIDPTKLYPEGSVLQSQEKWTWIITGKGTPETDWKGRPDGYKYPVRKLKGKKTFTMTISARGTVDVDDGKNRQGLYKVTVRPPR